MRKPRIDEAGTPAHEARARAVQCQQVHLPGCFDRHEPQRRSLHRFRNYTLTGAPISTNVGVGGTAFRFMVHSGRRTRDTLDTI
jgi:hypothetical protein